VGHRQRTILRHHAVQAHSRHVFHDQEMQIARLLGIVSEGDVRMRQPGQRPCLLTKALDEIRMIGEAFVQHFQGDDAIQDAMDRLVDDAHAAFAEHSQDAIAWMTRESIGDGGENRHWRIRSRGGLRCGGSAQQGHERIFGQIIDAAAALRAIGQVAFDLLARGRGELAGVESRQVGQTRMCGVGFVHATRPPINGTPDIIFQFQPPASVRVRRIVLDSQFSRQFLSQSRDDLSLGEWRWKSGHSLFEHA
jgi:hypothetical protein